jgi:hypothetical protein
VIHTAIASIVSELNAYLNLRSPTLDQNPLVAGSLFDLNGNLNPKTKDKVVLAVVNVEEERVYRSLRTHDRRPDGTSALVKPEVRVNLFLLFVANLDKYDEALKALSHVISFFQHRASFETAGNGARKRVAFELHSMTFEQQNHLWAALGAKYVPSVMYKAGFVEIEDRQVEGEVPPVIDLEVTA